MKRNLRFILLFSLIAFPIFGTISAQSSGNISAPSPIQPFEYHEDFAIVDRGPTKFNTQWVLDNRLKSFSVIEHLVRRKNKTLDEEVFHFDRKGRVVFERFWDADLKTGAEKHFTYGSSFFPLTRYSVWKGDTSSQSFYYRLNQKGWPASQYSSRKGRQDSTLYFYDKQGRLLRRQRQNRRLPDAGNTPPIAIDFTYDEEGRIIQQVWSQVFLGLNARSYEIADSDTLYIPYQIEIKRYEDGRLVGESWGDRNGRRDTPDSQVKLEDIPLTEIRYKLNERGLYAGHKTHMNSKPGTTLIYEHQYVYDEAGLLDYIDTFEVYSKKQKTSRIHVKRTEYTYEPW